VAPTKRGVSSTVKGNSGKRKGASDVEANQVDEPSVMNPPYTGIGRLLRTAHMAFMRLFTLNLAKLGMTFGQFQHLQYLWVSDGITQVELAEQIGIRPAASTAVLLSLEQEGYIRRIRNDVDRRKVNLFLTPKGREVKASLLECAKMTNDIARINLSEKNLQDLHRILGVMTESLVSASPDTAALGEDEVGYASSRA
jgi:DNA-binding MarR family transcriptional regulator